ncbi:MAG: penicillin-binding transpeptidase domain-containing protein, partial [bacterium]
KLCNFISAEQHSAALAEEIILCRGLLPFHAPHFCDLILKDNRAAEGDTVTTLDLNLQETAETVLRSRLTDLTNHNVSGAAVVIIDVKSAAVRAMVGSPDFSNAAAAGQVNTAIASRSPGSALKPFIYALALDQGICSPQTVLADIPMNYSGYRPSNFDLAFRGPVTVTEALVSSLNIPAMSLTQKVGLDNTVQTLQRLGISTLRNPPAHYGISIAIGTCEVTLLDLANAYACLAREGTFAPVRLTESDTLTSRLPRVFSTETAFMISDMLSGEARQFDISGHIADTVQTRVAWKTGTSSGRRDALAVAWNPEYVVAVWLGNPDGSAPRDVKGNDAAIAAHSIFRHIYPDGTGPWFERPAGLSTRRVCARSGDLPNRYCAS